MKTTLTRAKIAATLGALGILAGVAGSGILQDGPQDHGVASGIITDGPQR